MSRSVSGNERLGLFGGSFDPIHLGHIEPVRAALEALHLDRVLYLPTARPPHKRQREFAAAARRFAMVELALLQYPLLQVDNFEMSQRESYTVDTVRAFSPGRDLFLFLGADSLYELDQWKQWREIVDCCELVILQRPGYSLLETELKSLSAELQNVLDRDRVHVVEHEQWSVSSTQVRQTLARRGVLADDLQSQIPAPVLKYLQKYGLYGSAQRREPQSEPR